MENSQQINQSTNNSNNQCIFKDLKEFITQLSEMLNNDNQRDHVQTYNELTLHTLIQSQDSNYQEIKNFISETPIKVLFQAAHLTKHYFQLQIPQLPLFSEQKTEEINYQELENNSQNEEHQSNSEEVERQVTLNNNNIIDLKKCKQDKQEKNQNNNVCEKQIDVMVENDDQKQLKLSNPQKLLESQYGYDMIIKMKSIFDLQNSDDDQSQGLKVEQFNNHIDPSFKDVIIVGMQGQRNKGKTFVLNSLINERFPSDFHVSTPGICIKYNSLNNKNIVYVDSEGIGCPITIDYDKNRHYKQFMNNKKDHGKEDFVSQNNLTLDIQDRHHDLKVTEQIQQEFIIDNSNILIIVVSYLTLDDQKLIHCISQKFMSDTNKQKKLIVIHNLKEFRVPHYIKEYIEELKNIFPIEQQSNQIYKKTYQDENNYIYVDNINSDITHLFMGQQGSEAGRVFNKFTLFYLKDIIEMYQDSINFNIQQKLVEYLNKNLQSYVIIKQKSEEAKQNSNEPLKYYEEKKSIMLQQGFYIERVKELQVNVFGSLQKDCYYSIVNNDEKKERYAFIEIPGKTTFKKKFDKRQGILEIIIQQNDSIEKEYGTLQVSTRKFEEKLFKIQICKEKELWNIHHNQQENLANGVHKFVFTKEILLQ